MPSMTMNLSTEPAPHLHSSKTDAGIMRDVIAALLFPAAAAVCLFGARALVMCVTGVVSAVLFEAAYQKAAGKEITVRDYSAAVTGLLVALSLPVTAPLWAIILGNAFAIIVIKQLSGGLGRNILNPAVGARVMLKIFFEPRITQWVMPGTDAVSTATPLEYIGHFSRSLSPELPPLEDLFWGYIGGEIGTTSKLFIILGFGYLACRKIIDPKAPMAVMLGVAAIILPYSGFNLTFTAYHALSGALLFAAVYMVTDYSSGPMKVKAKILFAFLVGVLTAALRIVLDLPGGIGIAILIMNLFANALDKICTPRVVGCREKEPVQNLRQPRQ